jgi:putative flippase GtrA
VRALLVAVPTIVLGWWLLHFDVTHFGLDPVSAYRYNWPIITFLCFVLNYVFVFDDRHRDRKSLIKWVLVSLLHSGFSQYFYPKLVHSDINYLLANAILLGVSPLTYLIHSLFTFRKEKSTDKA